MRPHLLLRTAALVLTLSFLALAAPAAILLAETPRGELALDIKRVQQRALMERARAKIVRARALSRHRGKLPATGARSRKPRDEGDPVSAQAARAAARAQLEAPPSTLALGPNVLANNRATDLQPGSGQSEESIAARGQYVLVAWNDGEGFGNPPPNDDVIGYGYSTNGGVSFTDGGVPPKGANWTWTSDPVVTVNERTGTFYVCALVDSTPGFNGIGIVPATFAGAVLTWGTPRMIRKVNSSFQFLDKEWVVADSSSDSLYVSYTTFTFGANYIQFQRSANGVAWTAPVTLSAAADSGWVQGSRPVVGPLGEVYATWAAIGPIDVDYFRIRKSTNLGASFGAEVTIPSGGAPAFGYYGNFGSGAPGYNRQKGVTFPSIAVDRSGGANRGRVYVTWNESINFYDDAGGGAGARSEPLGESGANDSLGGATPFTVGNTLRGALGSSSDRDYWSFSATQGQTGVFFVDSASVSIDLFLRVFCTDGTTQLAVSYLGTGPASLVVFTFPSTGTYYLRCASSGGIGGYRIRTKFSVTGPERARDHRDVFVTSSVNGVSGWSVPNRVNDDPGYFDDWLPEVAVSGQGQPFVEWYDWRDTQPAKCGGVSNTYLSFSSTGGASWSSLGPITDASSDWTNVASNIAPNQGDYIGLYANGVAVYPAWADGRNGDPDVYTFAYPLQPTPTQPSLVSADALADRVTLTWHAPGAEGLPVMVYRRPESGGWTALGEIIGPADARVVYTDRAVSPGDRLGYRIGVVEGGAESFYGETWVNVPRYGLTLSPVAPNPAARDLWVDFSLPKPAPATLSLLDVAGRAVRSRELGSLAGPQRVNLGEGAILPAGIYLVRLTQGGKSLFTRVSVVR